MQINSQHEAPVFAASVGHVKIGLVHPHTAPVSSPEPAGDTAATRRRSARAARKQRKSEVAQGAPFLRRLTGTSVAEGLGEWQGSRAPSQLAGILGGASGIGARDRPQPY